MVISSSQGLAAGKEDNARGVGVDAVYGVYGADGIPEEFFQMPHLPGIGWRHRQACGFVIGDDSQIIEEQALGFKAIDLAFFFCTWQGKVDDLTLFQTARAKGLSIAH